MIAHKATKREWTGLAVLALPCILATMDLTVLNLAVPHLSAELHPSASQLLWIMDIYGFFIAASLITMGTLGDRIGRRKLLMMGAAAFGTASMLAAFSKSATILIVTRALLGIAGATLAPSTLSLIRNMFHDEHERTVAIGIWVTCFSVGAAIGPLLGGILLEHFWWGSVFLLNVPVMFLLLVLGPLLLPEFSDPNAGRLDLTSAGLSLSAVLLAIYGLKATAEQGFHSISLLCVLAGFAIGTIFVRRQKRLADPLIDLRLFEKREFTAALCLNMFGCFIAFGAFFFTGQYLQLVLGLSPLKAGLWSTPSSLAFILGSMLTPQLVRRIQPSVIIASGLLIATIGFGMLSLVDRSASLGLLVTALSIYSLGISPIFTLSTDLVVGSAPPEKAGAAASLSETSTEFGGALGMAILGSLGTALYRRDITAALPVEIPAFAANMARTTLGGAIAAARDLPAAAGGALIEAAHMAFGHALRTTAIACAFISILMALLTLGLLRSDQKK